MNTTFNKLNNGSESCEVKRRNIKIKDSRENTNYHRAVAVQSVVSQALELGGPGDLSFYLEKAIDAFRDITFPTSRTKEGMITEAAYIVKRYHSYLMEEGINPITNLPPLAVNVGEVVVTGVKPSFLYVKNDKIHVVKIQTGKPNLSTIRAFNRKDLYVLLQYGRYFVPAGKTLEVVSELHFLRNKNDKSDSIEKDYDDKNIVSVCATYGLLSSGSVCGEIGSDTPCMSKGMFDEESCPYNMTDCHCLHKINQSEYDRRMLLEFSKEEECTEEDCALCSLNAVCHYKRAPLSVAVPKIAKSISELDLSEDQERAISFEEGILKINAGAGAGKTVVVAARTAVMLSKEIDPEKILLITFTNTGASEMKERIELYCNDFGLDIDMDRLLVTTFNAFGQLIIEDQWKNLGFSEKPKLIDEVERYGIIADLLENNVVPGIDYRNFNSVKTKSSGKGALEITKQVFSIIKTYNLSYSPEDVGVLESKLGKDLRFLKEESVEPLFSLYDKYYKVLKAENLIEYQDQENLIFEVLRLNPYYLEDLGIEHIIIDEFQDTSEKQMDLIKQLVESRNFKSLMVVGDDSQAIFGFRDTTPEYIINFFENLGLEGEEIFLTENHRSIPEILDIANKVNDLNKDKVIKSLKATRKSGKKPVVLGFYERDDEYEYIVDEIVKKIDAGTKPEDIAFIASTKTELIEMAALLREEGVPTIMLNPEPLLENSRVLGALALVRYLNEPDATKEALVYANVLEKGILKYSDEEINDYIEHMEEATHYRSLKGEKAKKEYLFKLLTDLNEEDEVYESFLKTLEGKSLSKITEYCYLFEEYGASSAIRRERNYSGVVLTTAHSSKGLEWPIVFNSISKYYSKEISNLSSKIREKAVEERRRLLFVSSTRARDELYLTGKYVSFGSAKDGYTYNPFLVELYKIAGQSFMPKPLSKEEKKLLKDEIIKKREERKLKRLSAS